MIVPFVNVDGAIHSSATAAPSDNFREKEAQMSVSLVARFGGLVLAVLGVALLVLSGTIGLRDSVARAQTPWTAPDSEKAKKNPLPSDKKTLEQGEKITKINCVSCHGLKGKGDGPAAVALSPKPADWTSKTVQDESDGELFWKITNGRGAM